MTNEELRASLQSLSLTQAEAARLLAVAERTVRRWAEGTQDIPGPAEKIVRAWTDLQLRGLAWRPDGRALDGADAQALAPYWAHAIELDDLLDRVDARGGPAAPWEVDLERSRATLGFLQVTFYKLTNGGFAPQSYRRADDVPPDARRDWQLLEDAYYCIATALADPGGSRVYFSAVQVVDHCLRFWDMHRTGIALVAKLPCVEMCAALGLPPETSERDCRLIALKNLELFSAITRLLYAAERYAVGDGVHVVTLEPNDLLPHAARFVTQLFAGEHIWGTWFR